MKLSNNFKIRTKLVSGFLTVALIVAIVGLIGYNATYKMYKVQDEFAERRLPSVQALLIISEAQTSIDDSVNLILLNAINGIDYKSQLKNIDDALKKAESEWETYTAMPATTEEEEMQEYFMPFWNVWKTNINNFVELANQYNTSQTEDIKNMMIIKKMSANDKYYANSKAQLEKLVQLNVEYTNAARVDAGVIYDSISKLLILTVSLGFLLAALLGLFLSSTISKPIIVSASITGEIAKGNLSVPIKTEQGTREIGQMFMSLSQMVEGLKELVTKISMTSQSLTSSSQQLATASEGASSISTDIATTINQLAEGTADQAQEMQNVSNNINRTSSDIENMSINAARAVEGSKRVFDISNNGLIVSENAVIKIKAIQKTSLETSKVINSLGEESKKINEIVDVIKAISEQTNLLALNAAIEAARAGEYGKGFAVVADEVRKLAEQSSTSAQQITELIAKIHQEIERAVTNMTTGTKEVDEGVVIVSEAGDSFRTIVGEIENIVLQIENVNESIQSVAISSDDIAKSISSAAAITEEAAASTEEISASSEEQVAAILEVASSSQELAKMAEELNSVVSRFKL
ncbi:MAG: hypothetical protein APF77_13855 [Clostridia bacterium BRH_c25]|nr:MAG: hypothetical protein APF77_13855 [Clostridia bacterium BRH_c25]